MDSLEPFLAAQSRRQFFRRSGLTLGSAALAALLRDNLHAAPALVNPLAPHPPHFAPKAKRVIYLHMIGAPSQLDLFDEKPTLVQRDGQDCPDELLAGKRFAFIGGQLKPAGTKFKFAPHGQSGQQFSDLLPHLATVADNLAVVRSLHTE